MKLLILVCIVAAVLLMSTQYESFANAPEPAMCKKIKKGKYPQISMDGVLDRETCQDIIKAAEAHATEVGGWETDRHENYPTTDFDTADIPALAFPIQNITYRKIIPKIAEAYELDPLRVGISEVFIAKYSAEKGAQKSLAKHVDGSDFSFVIALNDDFTGGGTKFVNGVIKKPSAGGAVGFCGQTKHQGLKVTSGTRYILAGFLSYAVPGGCHS